MPIGAGAPPDERRADAVCAAVASWLAEYAAAADPLIVACSGGTDSLALAVSAHEVLAGQRTAAGCWVPPSITNCSPAPPIGPAPPPRNLADIGYRQVEVLTVRRDRPGRAGGGRPTGQV